VHPGGAVERRENPASAPSVMKYKNNLQLPVDFFVVLASKQCDDGE
jgi:hypothetical protein